MIFIQLELIQKAVVFLYIYIKDNLHLNKIEHICFTVYDFIDMVTINLIINNKNIIISGIYK